MLVVAKWKAYFISVLLVVLNAQLANGRSVSHDSNDLESQGSTRQKILRQSRLPISSRDDRRLPPSTEVTGPSSTTSANQHNRKFPLKSGPPLLVLPFLRTALPKDWCKTRKFLQKIHHHGCNSTYITNNMCVGQCLSVFIPNHFVSCSYCTPVEKDVISVELKCPGRSQPVVKKVSIIKSCKCRPCGHRYT